MGYEAEDREHTDTGRGMQFVTEYEISQSGTVIQWEIFTHLSAEIVLQVFREQSTPLNFDLVGSTSLQAVSGHNRVEANIDVLAGDVLGW